MKGFLNLFGMSVGGWIGWALGAQVSFFAAFIVKYGRDRRRALLQPARHQTASTMNADFTRERYSPRAG